MLRQRGAAKTRRQRTEKEQKRELHSVCSGLIRVIISLSLPGLVLSWHTHIHAQTHTYSYMHTDSLIHLKDREGENAD